MYNRKISDYIATNEVIIKAVLRVNNAFRAN